MFFRYQGPGSFDEFWTEVVENDRKTAKSTPRSKRQSLLENSNNDNTKTKKRPNNNNRNKRQRSERKMPNDSAQSSPRNKETSHSDAMKAAS